MLSLAVVLPGYHHDYTVYTETLYDKLEEGYLYDVFVCQNRPEEYSLQRLESDLPGSSIYNGPT